MPIPLYTVDAFATTAFGGNPAAVCLGFQASRRGGVVHTRVTGDRVRVWGPAVTVLRGWLAC